MRVEVVKDLAAFERLGSAWTEALDRYSPATVHVSFPWVRCCWETSGADGPVLCLVAREGERLLGMVPLRLERRTVGPVSVPVVRLLGNEISMRSDVVVVDRADDVLDAFAREIHALPWDYFDLGRVPSASHATRLFQRSERDRFSAVHRRRTFQAPAVRLRGTWDEFLAAKSINFRRTVRRSEGGGPLTVRRFPGEVEDFAAMAEAVLDVSRGTWKHRVGTSLAADAEQWAFLARVMRVFHETGNLLVTLLYHGESPVAFLIAVIHRRVMYAIKTGYLDSWAGASPGVRVLAELVRQGIADGRYERLDLDCVATHGDYKLRWATQVDEVAAYYAFRRRPVSRLLATLHGCKQRIDRLVNPPGWATWAG